MLWKKLQGYIWYNPLFIHALSDVGAGLLLSRLVFWFSPNKKGDSKVKVKKEGKFWVAKTRQEWGTEIGLTPKQFDRACGVLETHGLIESKVMIFSGRKAVHLSLQLAALEGFVSSQKVKMHIDQMGICMFPKGQYDIHIDLTHRQHVKTSNGVATPQTMDSNEALKTLQEKYKPSAGFKLTHVVKNTQELASWWMKFVPYFYDMKVKPLTNKELGQLKLFMSNLGKDHAYTVMLLCVRHWEDFVLAVKDTKGENTAKVPHIGALLKHWDAAFTLVQGLMLDLKGVQLIAGKGEIGGSLVPPKKLLKG